MTGKIKKKVFISYSHEDASVAKEFAVMLSLYGFDIWMDVKDIENGEHYTTKILEGIKSSDLYVVFLSQKSIKSNWVEAEIDFALKEKIENKRLRIVPVLLEDVEIPIGVSNIDYLDARGSILAAAKDFAEQNHMRMGKPEKLTLSSISFAISEDTAVQISPFNEEITNKDLKENCDELLAELRRRACGILLNFVKISDFDFQAEKPRFANGVYEERIVKKEGNTNGSICENVTVEAIVLEPDVEKVKRMLEDRLRILDVRSITFGFSVPLEGKMTMRDIGVRCFQKIQDQSVILSYDPKEGAQIELADDFYASVAVTEDGLLKIKLSAKYRFEFADRMKNFSVLEFVMGLLN